MSRPLQRAGVQASACPDGTQKHKPSHGRFAFSRFQFFGLLFSALLAATVAHAQFSGPDANPAHSISGQFIVTGAASSSTLFHLPVLATNADFVRLEPALLAVTAERVKIALRQELGIEAGAPWNGKIFLVLHPAEALDEEVLVIAQPFLNNWNYRVELPDVMPQPRFLRALTSVLLQEMANRSMKPGGHSAEIPAWLADGLSQQLLAAGQREIILSSPGKTVNGLPQTREVASERGLDSLAAARQTLREQPVLTFEELSWPTDTQLNGEDGGAYRASAQVFVNGLLELKNGPAHVRAMLEMLPACYNWQTAFHAAFHDDFPRPLDVEKWWSLQVVGFAARDRGPVWTPAVSREKLDEILSVPVAMRTASNALPTHAEISLQQVIRSFEKSRQTAILQTKLRDLRLAQLRMSGPMAALADGYRRALALYLGEATSATRAGHLGRQAVFTSRHAGAAETLQKLDALDAQRRAAATAVKPDVMQLR